MTSGRKRQVCHLLSMGKEFCERSTDGCSAVLIIGRQHMGGEDRAIRFP